MKQRPLGQFEQAFTLTNRAYGLVVVGVLRLRQGPPPEVLREALDRVQERHPLLRMHIAPEKRGFAFVPMRPVAPIALDVLERRGGDHWQTLAQGALNRPFAPAQGPLMRCVYLVSQTPDTAADLICAFHHAIMDAPSGTHLYDELLSLCAVLQDAASAVPEPEAPLTLQPPTDALLPPAYSGLGLARRLVPFVVRQVQEDYRYHKQTRKHRRPPLHPQSPCHLHTLTLSTPTTRRLVEKTRSERVTLNSVLAAALLLAVYRRRYPPEARPLRTLVFSNLRPYLQPSVPAAHLGCYISMQRVSAPVSPHDTLWTLAHLLNEALYAANKRGEKYLAAIVSKRIMQRTLRKQNERMAATALSYVGPLQLKSSYGPIEVTDVHGFITANRLSPECAAFGHLFLGRLTLDVMYLTADMDPDQARAIVEDVQHLLTRDLPA